MTGIALGVVGCGGGSGVATPAGGTAEAGATRTPQTSRTPAESTRTAVGQAAAPSRTPAATEAGASAAPSRTPTATEAHASATPSRTPTATARPSRTATAAPTEAATATPAATSTPRATIVVVTPTPTSTTAATPSATAAAETASSSTPWGWIVAAVLAVVGLVVGGVALVRRSRRRAALQEWTLAAIDAYRQAGVIDDLAARDPHGSPELFQRIGDVRATFYALAASGPDLPSMQATHVVYTALAELDTALRRGRPAAEGVAAPPAVALGELTVGEARGALQRALGQLWPLLGNPLLPG